MDTLGDILEPHSESIAKFAGTVTCFQFLSGIFLLNDIRKIGCSDSFPAGPFLGGIVLTLLSLKYGSLIGDAAMIKVNLIGFGINAIFMLAFYWYSSERNKSQVIRKIGIAGMFTFACLTYAAFENPTLIEFRFFMIITAILVALVGSPLLDLGEIIRKQNTENLPLPVIIAGTIVSLSWMFYGISIRNHVLVYQNAFLLFLTTIQLSLCFIYSGKKSSRMKSSSPVKGKSVKKID